MFVSQIFVPEMLVPEIMEGGWFLMQGNFLSPAEIAKYVVDVGQKKAGLSPFKQLLLGVLAGAFIALAAQGSNAAIHTVE